MVTEQKKGLGLGPVIVAASGRFLGIGIHLMAVEARVKSSFRWGYSLKSHISRLFLVFFDDIVSVWPDVKRRKTRMIENILTKIGSPAHFPSIL